VPAARSIIRIYINRSINQPLSLSLVISLFLYISHILAAPVFGHVLLCGPTACLHIHLSISQSIHLSVCCSLSLFSPSLSLSTYVSIQVAYLQRQSLVTSCCAGLALHNSAAADAGSATGARAAGAGASTGAAGALSRQ